MYQISRKLDNKFVFYINYFKEKINEETMPIFEDL